MNAKDLRIGNLVLRENKGIVEIVSLSEDSVWHKRISDFTTIQKHISFFNPIPLTEEWLRKFGFITLDNEIDFIEWGLDDNKNGAEFSIISDGFDKRVPLYFEYDLGQYLIRKKIKYVHQLQNLYFALTREELNFKK